MQYSLMATMNPREEGEKEVDIQWPVPLYNTEELTKAIVDLIKFHQEDVSSFMFTVVSIRT